MRIIIISYEPFFPEEVLHASGKVIKHHSSKTSRLNKLDALLIS